MSDITPKISTDLDILQRSYENYEDKTGRKARNLAFRIENGRAMEELIAKAHKRMVAELKELANQKQIIFTDIYDF
jgi:hypothetical protein